MKNIDYFDYKTLANPRFIAPKHFSSVCSYGNYKAVARLKKSRFNFITEYLEHGVNFYCQPESVKRSGYADRPFIKRIYTYGNIRKSTLETFCDIHNLKRKVIAIGPYIKGAEFFKTKEERSCLKQKYGRILLVFPSHSISTIHVKYNESALMQEIFKIKDDFDTIFICLHWLDILSERLLFYEKYVSCNLKIVSAGNSHDPRFLSRLKDLIWLSNITLSNDIGTHLGYSICMEKPHYLFKQKIDYITNDTNVNAELYSDTTKFYELFNRYPAIITPEQIALIERYWGEWQINI
jgi:hypothetical protein